ncbi:hypothetical protein ACFQBU_09305 [Jhaorihella thermophila]
MIAVPFFRFLYGLIGRCLSDLALLRHAGSALGFAQQAGAAACQGNQGMLRGLNATGLGCI